jgi:transposase
MDDTTLGMVLLGLDDFELTAAEQHDGEVWLHVQTTARAVICPACCELAVMHNRRITTARDMPVGDRPARLVWSKRVWRCTTPWCARVTWTERQPDVLLPRMVMTERARRHACREVGRGHTVADLARRYGVGWDTIMAAVIDHGSRLVDDPVRTADVTALGVDETSFLAASYTAKRRTQFVTGLVDLHRGRLLDIVDGRAGSAVTAWLSAREDGWLSAVERVSLDPHRGYYNALVGGLDCPTVVVDAFHVVRLANAMVDDVRRRIQQEQLGHRGRTGDPLYGIRRLLLTGAERLNTTGRQRLGDGLAAGDPDAGVWYAHHCKELVRSVYRADGAAEAADRLEEFFADADAVDDIPELTRLARTLRRWQPEVLAYWDTDGLTNAASESVNALIKRIKRIGHGFRNKANYRLRLLLFCGGVDWQDAPTASIRGRSPRLAG